MNFFFSLKESFEDTGGFSPNIRQSAAVAMSQPIGKGGGGLIQDEQLFESV